jgi:hypothetical protein
MRRRAGASLPYGRACGAAVAFACADVTTEQVTKDVCHSELRWVGGKRGSEEMYPGRDCVGCHIQNDGPELVLGGTVYAYLISDRELYAQLQTGADCFGLEGVTVRITDAERQVFELVTNRAGNFFVEGNPSDFIKPFQVEIEMGDIERGMSTRPKYGGCAHCHDPTVPTATELGVEFELTPRDADYQNGTARIGVPSYRPSGPGTPSVEEELMDLAGIER